MRGFLVIGPKQRKQAAKILKHSKKRANWYNPTVAGWMNRIPGHMREHTCKMGNYRCVFSWTLNKHQRVFRHLTVSVPDKDKYPLPEGILMIAPLFGFTTDGEKTEAGFPASWGLDVKDDHPIDDPCVEVIEYTGIKA
jgi:hypothetical protein